MSLERKNCSSKGKMHNRWSITRRILGDVPTIPLYQKPTYFVFKTSLKGLVDNPTLQGPTWNTESWKAG